MFKKKVKSDPNTHDYTIREWGHDFNVMSMDGRGVHVKLAGWGRGIRTGDFLILPNKGGVTRYRVTKIDYCHDPPDMWFADAKFDPRVKGGILG